MNPSNEERLRKIVWFAGFEGRNSTLVFKLIQQKNWQHIFNSGVRMANRAREMAALA